MNTGKTVGNFVSWTMLSSPFVPAN